MYIYNFTLSLDVTSSPIDNLNVSNACVLMESDLLVSMLSLEDVTLIINSL